MWRAWRTSTATSRRSSTSGTCGTWMRTTAPASWGPCARSGSKSKKTIKNLKQTRVKIMHFIVQNHRYTSIVGTCIHYSHFFHVFMFNLLCRWMSSFKMHIQDALQRIKKGHTVQGRANSLAGARADSVKSGKVATGTSLHGWSNLVYYLSRAAT